MVGEDNHELAYRDSGLCPKCFGKAMESMKGDTLVDILEVDKAILENIKLVNVSLLKPINACAYCLQGNGDRKGV